MTLTFGNIDLTIPAHTKPLAEGLVLGFVINDYVAGTETVYALNNKGDAFTTGARKPSPNFSGKGWTKMRGTIPATAEFIGHYPSVGA